MTDALRFCYYCGEGVTTFCRASFTPPGACPSGLTKPQGQAMTADQLIQNARDTAQRLYPEDEAQRAQYEAEMLRRYLREVISLKSWMPDRDEVVSLICNVADNLGDMPISDSWADKTAQRAFQLLERNDYFRS